MTQENSVQPHLHLNIQTLKYALILSLVVVCKVLDESFWDHESKGPNLNFKVHDVSDEISQNCIRDALSSMCK